MRQLQAPCNHCLATCAAPWPDACVWPAVKQCDNPTDEEVDRVHALVVEAVVQLYERYKHLVPGWENRLLLVL